MDYADSEILLYDLGNRPSSFDIVTAMSIGIPNGFKHVRFVLGKWKKKNYNNPEMRFKSIVEPAVALFGMTYSIGERRGVEINHFLPKCIDTFKEKGRIGKVVLPVMRGDYVTLTLRKSRTPERNSKEAEWLKFASRCDRRCLVIRDYEERPIALEDRARLYAGAYMNIMISQGPLSLCIHSAMPYIGMRMIGNENSDSASPEFMKRIGITPGFQFPWANSLQRLCYDDDTCENIERAYSDLCQLQKAA